MSEITRKACNECSRPPRRLSLMMEGKLFCQRKCYLDHCGKIWDRLFAETFSKHKPPNVIDIRKGKK